MNLCRRPQAASALPLLLMPLILLTGCLFTRRHLPVPKEPTVTQTVSPDDLVKQLGYGGGGGGSYASGGGGSSWVTPGSTYVGSQLASKLGNGKVTIQYDSTSDLCTVVVPGAGHRRRPDHGHRRPGRARHPDQPSALDGHCGVEHACSYPAPPNPCSDRRHQPWTTPHRAGTVTFAPFDTTAIVHIPVLADQPAITRRTPGRLVQRPHQRPHGRLLGSRLRRHHPRALTALVTIP